MTRGTLATLRDVMPARALTQGQALRIAELQAQRLLAISGVKEPPVPMTVITDLPKIVVQRMAPWPVSGATHWTKGTWSIVIRGNEPLGRRRFTLAHEFKHIVDNRHIDFIYPATRTMTHRQRAEAVCDYFAGCLLIPRTWLKKAWASGVQDTKTLAALFQATPAAIQTRLLQTGLVEQTARCEDPADNVFYRVGHDFSLNPDQVVSAAVTGKDRATL